MLQYLIEDLNLYGDGIIPDGYYSDDEKIPLDVDGTNTRIKKPQTIKFTDTYLKKQLPFLKKYTSIRLFEMISNTSKFRDADELFNKILRWEKLSKLSLCQQELCIEIFYSC